MEFVEGETLAQVLSDIKDGGDESETPFGPKGRQDYFIQLGLAFAGVADGLQHAHARGVVHRDVKPGNLLLDMRGNVWIADFGLAKATDQQGLTHTGDVLGTLRYMAPEQFNGRADARSDV